MALSYVPGRHRPALKALFAIDAAMGDVVRTSTDPTLGAIRLAWWREQLEQLDQAPAPAEPRLQAVARELGPRGVTGGDIAALEGGWRRLFEPFPWDVGVAEAIWLRGRDLFALGVRVLGKPDAMLETAGGAWALADIARHCSDDVSRKMLIEQAQALSAGLRGARFAAALRPLSMLGALALRDIRRGDRFESEGSPGRIAVMLGHRLSGRI
ncbi:MAG: hypothetical protein ABI626_01260 [Sphingomicrobium sp.]